MKEFMDDNFLLENKTAIDLYHNYAKNMPIFDFHNHLSVKEIYEDINLPGITYAWLGFDHYKWRLMRANGVDESYITGNKDDYSKFEKWASTVPYTFNNPIYHWTHLELSRYFGINETLSLKNSKEIYDICNQKLSQKDFSIRKLIEKMNIYALCTTDDPIDDLKYHKGLKEDGYKVKVLPTFRPDKAISIHKDTFINYVNELSKVVGYQIESYQQLEEALIDRIMYFHEVGARFADHGLDEIFYLESSIEEVNEIFKKAMNNQSLTIDEIRKYQGRLQNTLAKKYHELNWTLQIHIGALRNNSSRNFYGIGPDSGYDSINDGFVAKELSKLLDSLDVSNQLPKTIIYCLNAKDNEVIASMINNFQDGKIIGKIQFGPAWWFNDTKHGMIEHFNVLSSMGLISRFVGMLTDSRSFLSFTRHEYFRRIICNEIGKVVEKGEYPNDMEFLGSMVQDICFNNIKKYTNI
ncbi:MAG: glucuronate isomerase [Erysipelotrichaceae bacterium]|nr:glucuronate isomerase [Erysipelotrichaceae bacterium]